jgi:hypothetical protein
MTKRRTYPLTRAEVEGRVSDLRDRLALLAHSVQSTSVKREIAGTKAALHILERKLEDMTNANT